MYNFLKGLIIITCVFITLLLIDSIGSDTKTKELEVESKAFVSDYLIPVSTGYSTSYQYIPEEWLLYFSNGVECPVPESYFNIVEVGETLNVTYYGGLLFSSTLYCAGVEKL